MLTALTLVSMLCSANPNAAATEDSVLIDHVVFDALGSTSFQTFANGKTYETRVQIEAMARAPMWKDADENPPLSARKALKLASEKAPQFQAIWNLKNQDDRFEWHTNGARLCRASSDRWCWIVSYVALAKTGGTTGTPMAFRMIILMDGSVFGPEMVRESPFRIPLSPNGSDRIDSQ